MIFYGIMIIKTLLFFFFISAYIDNICWYQLSVTGQYRPTDVSAVLGFIIVEPRCGAGFKSFIWRFAMS